MKLPACNCPGLGICFLRNPPSRMCSCWRKGGHPGRLVTLTGVPGSRAGPVAVVKALWLWITERGPGFGSLLAPCWCCDLHSSGLGFSICQMRAVDYLPYRAAVSQDIVRSQTC